MSEEEFVEKRTALLLRLPEELRLPLAEIAYEEGHSGGLGEIINYLFGYVYALEEPCKRLVERLQGRKT